MRSSVLDWATRMKIARNTNIPFIVKGMFYILIVEPIR